MEIVEQLDFIKKTAWFHTISLGNGISTRGIQDHTGTLARAALPTDLTGKRVLDIGANDGYYSFECERRGATVTAIDMWARKYDNTRSIENIQFCKEVLRSKINIRQQDFLHYVHFPYDVVLFMGVLYHLKDMMLGIKKIAELTKPDGLAIIETHYDSTPGRPCAVMYPGTECNADPTNWWGPNEECVVAMLKVYFEDVVVTARKDDRIGLHARRPKSENLDDAHYALQSGM